MKVLCERTSLRKRTKLISLSIRSSIIKRVILNFIFFFRNKVIHQKHRRLHDIPSGTETSALYESQTARMFQCIKIVWRNCFLSRESARSFTFRIIISIFKPIHIRKVRLHDGN